MIKVVVKEAPATILQRKIAKNGHVSEPDHLAIQYKKDQSILHIKGRIGLVSAVPPLLA